MNERIKLLAEQAGIEFDDDLALEPETIYYTTQEDLEKFAELIVQECVSLAQDRAAFDGYPPNDVNDIIDEIREHFGVEE